LCDIFEGNATNSVCQSILTDDFLAVGKNVHTKSTLVNVSDQKNNVAAFHSDISQTSKVHSLPLKNALNNSTGHLALHSEQRTPITGSQKRKNKRSSMPSSDFAENGSGDKIRKLSDNEGIIMIVMRFSKFHLDVSTLVSSIIFVELLVLHLQRFEH